MIVLFNHSPLPPSTLQESTLGQDGAHICGQPLQSVHSLPYQSGYVLELNPGQDGAHTCGQPLQSGHRLPNQSGHVLGSTPVQDGAHIRGLAPQIAHRLPSQSILLTYESACICLDLDSYRKARIPGRTTGVGRQKK